MINIGTNFEYQGDLFLDDRQGQPQTTDDLLNWSIPIPEGFEVCLSSNKTWYTYNSTIAPDPQTGYFHKRIDYEYPGSIIEDWINYILSLLQQQPAQQLQFNTFTVSPNSTTLEVNSSPINISINWTLKKGSNTVEPTNATVNGSSTGVSSDFKSYTATGVQSLTEPGSKHFTVKVWYNNEEVSKTHTINYKYKKYFGTSSNPNITPEEAVTLGSTWAGSWTMGTTIFDCTGGKYPYYIIPTRDYNPSTFTMWVSGLVDSDINVTNMTINGAAYTVIRHNNIQSGALRIEFKL
jgi:hypothetical protein